ncbi:MAG TPA: hypothetical protein DCE41_27600 [Cytophagales bacterium]|nr:hypothetical protein [Cytophagales bacterium]HAA20999.1 hypothetical protein [Cytophagales bacterium]HAP61531.1 hypothetical protein [Cytophagales bacterium]
MSNSDRLHLHVLQKAIHKIIRYLGGFTDREAFLQNEMAVDAVIRNFELVGATAERISTSLKARYPELPWNQLISFYHRPMQSQYPIEPAILWELGMEHLPQHLLMLEVLREEE